MQNDKITQIIFQVIDDINLQLPTDNKLEKSLETVLTGPSGGLDSLGLVNLIVGVEERIEEEYGVLINLVTESGISPTNSPFKTVMTLTRHIASLLEKR